jgi:hypothetical protein
MTGLTGLTVWGVKRSKRCLVLKYVDTKKCRYEVQNYESGQDENCPRV